MVESGPDTSTKQDWRQRVAVPLFRAIGPLARLTLRRGLPAGPNVLLTCAAVSPVCLVRYPSQFGSLATGVSFRPPSASLAGFATLELPEKRTSAGAAGHSLFTQPSWRQTRQAG